MLYFESFFEPKEIERPIVEGGFPGKLKMHLKAAHVEFHAGPPLERMSPFVIVRCGEWEWRSREKEDAGHDAEWELEECELEVVDHRREMVVEVRDHAGLMENPPLGEWRGEVGFFAK